MNGPRSSPNLSMARHWDMMISSWSQMRNCIGDPITNIFAPCSATASRSAGCSAICLSLVTMLQPRAATCGIHSESGVAVSVIMHGARW